MHQRLVPLLDVLDGQVPRLVAPEPGPEEHGEQRPVPPAGHGGRVRGGQERPAPGRALSQLPVRLPSRLIPLTLPTAEADVRVQHPGIGGLEAEPADRAERLVDGGRREAEALQVGAVLVDQRLAEGPARGPCDEAVERDAVLALRERGRDRVTAPAT